LILATIYAYFKNGKNIKIQGCYPLMDLSTVKGLTLFLIFAGLTLIFAYFGNTYFIYGNF
jgi:alginate O-acetyltransferase complex protein AlgI